MQLLPENVEIKKIYRGVLLFVCIYTKNLFFLINNIFHQKLIYSSLFTPIRWIWLKITRNLIFAHVLVKNSLKSWHHYCRPSVDFFHLLILCKPKHPNFIFCWNFCWKLKSNLGPLLERCAPTFQWRAHIRRLTLSEFQEGPAWHQVVKWTDGVCFMSSCAIMHHCKLSKNIISCII